MSTALRWIISIVILLMSIPILFLNPLAGLLLIFSGAMLLPAVTLPPKIQLSPKWRVVVAILLFVGGVSTLGAEGVQTPPTSPMVKDGNTISSARQVDYEEVETWSIPNGGYGKILLISPAHLNEADMLALGKKLKQEAAGDRHAAWSIFTDKEAAKLRQKVWNQKGTPEETVLFEKHYVAEYGKNSNTGHHEFTIWWDGVSGDRSQKVTY